MATTTPNYGWPVPTSADYVAQGAVAIEALGDAIDATVFGLPAPASGLTLINTTTFSAVASQSINNVFSATYTNYKVLVTLTSASTEGSQLAIRLRVAGTDAATTYTYWVMENNATSSSIFVARSTSATREFIGYLSNETAIYDLNVSQPFIAAFTEFTTIYASNTSLGAVSVGGTGFGGHKTATSYDGISVISTFGTITGSISIYGVAK